MYAGQKRGGRNEPRPLFEVFRSPTGPVRDHLGHQAPWPRSLDHVTPMIVPSIGRETIRRNGAGRLINAVGVGLVNPPLLFELRRGLRP